MKNKYSTFFYSSFFAFLLFFHQNVFSQAVVIQPNTGNNGNTIIKSTGFTYGHISTTQGDGADLIFRRNEPSNGDGTVGVEVGRISTFTDRFQLQMAPDHFLNFNLGGADRMRILSNGYLGLNTFPTRYFQVNGSTILTETADSANVQIGSTDFTDAKLVVMNTNFQNGVKIISPFNPGGYALNVDGTTLLDGNTVVNGPLVVSGNTQLNNATVQSSMAVIGNLSVGGTLSKASGSFKIDHPLDPENKILYHSFVESPDMMNVYNGNIITDEKGFATVQLPDYFEALNKDFRYQLTPIGSFAQAMVSQKVKNNQFIIQTDKPNIEISWQITGIRNDAYAEKFRIPNTVEKSSTEKGKYLYPEAFEKQ